MSIKGAKVLVTGGNGFLGRFVVDALKYEKAVPMPISRQNGYDLRNESETLTAFLLAKPDAVIHLAANQNPKAPASVLQDNLRMGMNIVNASAMTKAQLIVVADTTCYPEDFDKPIPETMFWNGSCSPAEAYGVAKRGVAAMCSLAKAQHGLRYAFLVLSELYGANRDKVSKDGLISLLIKAFQSVKDHGDTVVKIGTDPETRAALLHAGEAAQAIALAVGKLDHDGVINLISPDPPLFVKDVVERVKAKIQYDGTVEYSGDLIRKRVLAGELAKKLLDWSPVITVDEGIEEALEIYSVPQKAGSQ